MTRGLVRKSVRCLHFLAGLGPLALGVLHTRAVTAQVVSGAGMRPGAQPYPVQLAIGLAVILPALAVLVTWWRRRGEVLALAVQAFFLAAILVGFRSIPALPPLAVGLAALAAVGWPRWRPRSAAK